MIPRSPEPGKIRNLPLRDAWLRRASGDYHLILNPDMIFVSNPFPRLLQELARDPKIGAIGPLLYGTDGQPQIHDFYPRFPTVARTQRWVVGASCSG